MTNFVRNFEHVDGNWPSHFIFSVGKSSSGWRMITTNYFFLFLVDIDHCKQKLGKIANSCLQHFRNHFPWAKDIDNIQIEESPHILLSKPFVLSHFQIAPFTEEVKIALRQFSR